MTNKSSKIASSEIAAIAHKRKNVASSKTLTGLRYMPLSGFCLMLTIYLASGVVFAAEMCPGSPIVVPLLLFAVLFAIATRRAYCAAKRKGEAAHRVLRETDMERLSRRERKALEAEREAAEQKSKRVRSLQAVVSGENSQPARERS